MQVRNLQLHDEDKFGFSMRTIKYTKFTNERALHLTYTNICNKSCNICRPKDI